LSFKTNLGLLGEGEFGVVHKARWHGTVVAVKILKDTGAVAIGDFKTELNVLLKVHHTHTVSELMPPDLDRHGDAIPAAFI